MLDNPDAEVPVLDWSGKVAVLKWRPHDGVLTRRDPAAEHQPLRPPADPGTQSPDGYVGRLPPNRVTFSIGRDLTLEPKQAGGPVNFLVYPYVEADGKPHPADKVKGTFAFADE